ncbi:hypothetical protein [Devosia sp. Root413D1]|uniref:hypothetical protein n=1 Tax=Devosia sp. Root413D1 TaxID=1736531 RepID=UPI000ACEDA6D|nr:hypothetical protein [Devosia sp. Root413D1]
MTDPDQQPKPGTKRTNSLLWGAVAGGVVGLLVFLGPALNMPRSDNTLLQSPVSAAFVAFFWGWAAGSVKNWLGDRLFERSLGGGKGRRPW